ncbi:MAG: hypothetical protein AVDCRST_MAG76-3432 [uncultured Acidimicrobiales bacterium]|uniref:Uncharacterized protein n=1 Tax=uncultured Acidimicrobiales bacterium TaxID=310071 RepID=A0A6J4JBF7_9ACTN|nr:MAG: hypothetical protein AVDCRST_MAG76-3432 [uncultured Acidimicrobiales bacterium]
MSGWRPRPTLLLLGLAAAVLLVPAVQLLVESRFIPRISFENPTPYDIAIEVSGGTSDGWMPVGVAGRSGTTDVEEVYDVGAVWVFRFVGQGREAGELRLLKSQLELDGWRVRIPDRVEEQLRNGGASPTP